MEEGERWVTLADRLGKTIGNNTVVTVEYDHSEIFIPISHPTSIEKLSKY
jgi:hypothetical protein